MITFSSSIYALLLEHIHTMTKTECNLQQIPCDESDVYCFGGAILSDMHHAGYKVSDHVNLSLGGIENFHTSIII